MRAMSSALARNIDCSSYGPCVTTPFDLLGGSWDLVTTDITGLVTLLIVSLTGLMNVGSPTYKWGYKPSYTWSMRPMSLQVHTTSLLWVAKRPQKHKNPTSHGFPIPPCLGPQNQNVGSSWKENKAQEHRARDPEAAPDCLKSAHTSRPPVQTSVGSL